MLISWLFFYFFQLNCYVTLHGIQHISAHRHNQEPPPPQFSLLQQREAATESPGKNPPSFHFFTILISRLTFLFFHFNHYVTIHGIQHISAHRHNQELPPAQFSLLQQGEATTASPGQNPLSYHFFTMLISQLIFYFFSIKSLCHTPRDSTYLGPQTQPRAAACTALFTTAERSSDRKPRQESPLLPGFYNENLVVNFFIFFN